MPCCCAATTCEQCCNNLAAFPAQTSVPIDFDLTLTAYNPCHYGTFSYNFTTSVIAKNYLFGQNLPCRFFVVGDLDSADHPVCKVDGSFDMGVSSGSCIVFGQGIQLYLKTITKWPGATVLESNCNQFQDGCFYRACCFFPVASVPFSGGTCMTGAVVQLSGGFRLVPGPYITGTVTGTATFGSMLP